MIELAAQYGIAAAVPARSPGVYVAGRKLASVGVRVRRGGSYHGLAVNVALDLEPFRRINPCGYAGLEMTQLAELGGPRTVADCAAALEPPLLARAAASRCNGGLITGARLTAQPSAASMPGMTTLLRGRRARAAALAVAAAALARAVMLQRRRADSAGRRASRCSTSPTIRPASCTWTSTRRSRATGRRRPGRTCASISRTAARARRRAR